MDTKATLGAPLIIYNHESFELCVLFLQYSGMQWVIAEKLEEGSCASCTSYPRPENPGT